MPATPNLALPYPVTTDTADIPRDIKALADKLDLSGASGAALPASPTDGQVCYILADAANGIVWQFRYRAASLKWEFIGGPPIYSQAPASVTLPAGGYVDLADGLPTIALPLPGDYMVEWGAMLGHTGTGQGVNIAPAATGLAATGANSIFLGEPSASASMYAHLSRKYRATAISGTLKLQSSTGAAGGSASARWITATPIRVG